MGSLSARDRLVMPSAADQYATAQNQPIPIVPTYRDNSACVVAPQSDAYTGITDDERARWLDDGGPARPDDGEC